MTTYFIVNTLVLISALIYWQHHYFNPALLIVGTVGSILHTVAITSYNIAVSKGPRDLIDALVSVQSLLLVVVEVFLMFRVPSFSEFIALFVGFVGVLVVVIPG